MNNNGIQYRVVNRRLTKKLERKWKIKTQLYYPQQDKTDRSIETKSTPGFVEISSFSGIFYTRYSCFTSRRSFKNSTVSSFKTTMPLMEYRLRDNITINFSELRLVSDFFFWVIFYATPSNYFFLEKIPFAHSWIYFCDLVRDCVTIYRHRHYMRLFIIKSQYVS